MCLSTCRAGDHLWDLACGFRQDDRHPLLTVHACRGHSLDCELKQFRLAGSALMELGAAMELSTIALPSAFLPLSCVANLAKNLAGVSRTVPNFQTESRVITLE